MRAIVTGMIATYPVGGVVWDYGQYALGLERLGFEVFYLEDSGLASWSPNPAAFLKQSLAQLSPNFGARWHYRADNGQTFGIETSKFLEIIASVDLFLNISGGCLLREEYLPCPRKVFVDTDPGLNQFVNFPKWDKAPGWQGTLGYRGHDFFFTYAENIGKGNCNLPLLGLAWQGTRPVVVCECWETTRAPSGHWTTVMSWNPYQHYQRSIEYQGKSYGAKEMEFLRIERLPSALPFALEVAAAGKDVPRAHWEKLGWHVIDADGISATAEQYRTYIQQSRGEFSVAKNVYVETHSGWFSCRSVCYLAAGRPVVVQDTGFSEIIPCGEGVLTFTNLEEAAEAICRVEGDYSRHQTAARSIVKEYFGPHRVLGDMLGRIGLG